VGGGRAVVISAPWCAFEHVKLRLIKTFAVIVCHVIPRIVISTLDKAVLRRHEQQVTRVLIQFSEALTTFPDAGLTT